MGVHHLLARQQGGCDDASNCDNFNWYYSDTAYIVRWAIFGTLLLLFLVFLIGGYIHAQRRMKRGLAPLRYHAWLIPVRQRARFYTPPHAPAGYYHNAPYGYQNGTPLHTYGGPAPPSYGEHDYVPPYQPPEGSSKINPDQAYQNVYSVGSSSLSPPAETAQPDRAPGYFR